MFYFGFLTSHLPYLLLIVAPLCYYLFGSVAISDPVSDEKHEISIHKTDHSEINQKTIHFYSLNSKTAHSNCVVNYFGQSCNNKTKLYFNAPPRFLELLQINNLWSRPPPQLIM